MKVDAKLARAHSKKDLALEATASRELLRFERQRTRRLETARSGDVALACAAGLAGLGSLFGMTGALVGAIVGALLAIGLQLTARHI